MGLILDSSVLITAERRGYTVETLLKQVKADTGDQRVALSSVGLTEVVHGIYRAQTPERMRRRQAFLDEMLLDLNVFPYTAETAMLAGRIDGEKQAKGIVIPFVDLLIGATALSVGFAVLTTNLRHFRMIPGLDVVPF